MTNLIIIWFVAGLAGTAILTYGAAVYSSPTPPKNKIVTWVRSLTPAVLLLSAFGHVALIVAYLAATASYMQAVGALRGFVVCLVLGSAITVGVTWFL